MSVRLDPDQAAEGAAGAIVQRVLVEQVARRVRARVVLQRARIELLRVVGNANGEHIAPRVFAGEPAQAFETAIGSAEVNVQTPGGGIALDRGRVNLDGERFLVP